MFGKSEHADGTNQNIVLFSYARSKFSLCLSIALTVSVLVGVYRVQRRPEFRGLLEIELARRLLANLQAGRLVHGAIAYLIIGLLALPF